MLSNNVKKFRLEKNLTQRQLAEKVGTSQQQIQRIESGVQAARYDIAALICEALETPFEKIFPRASKALKQIGKKESNIHKILQNDDMINSALDAGINIDQMLHTFKFLLKNGHMGYHEIDNKNKSILWKAVQQVSNKDQFIVYDTNDETVILNINHVTFSQFLFDPQNRTIDKDETNQEDESYNTIKFFTIASKEPLEFEVDPDETEPSDMDDEYGQLQGLIFDAEMAYDEESVFSFVDIDGERAFFRARDVSMVTIPLSLVNPKLFESEVDGYREDSSKEPDRN